MEFDELLASGQSSFELLNGGVGFVKQLRELVNNWRDKGGIPAAEVAELTLQLQEHLIDAREAQLALLSALGDLKREMIDVDRRLELQSRYEPFTTAGGAFVLALRGDDDRGEPSHYICPDCADEGRKSFLQPMGTGKRCNFHDRFFPFEESKNDIRVVKRRWDPLDPYGDM